MNDFSMKSHDVLADLKHYFDNGGYGKIGMRYADRQSDSNYAFGGSGVNPATNTINVTGLGIEAEQKPSLRMPATPGLSLSAARPMNLSSVRIIKPLMPSRSAVNMRWRAA